jgi:DNA-binding transcriptional LysR family regulator
MELRQLQYFLLVAQDLSFSKASRRAYVCQQALSRSIISLENELEVPLFERLTHGLVLTKYGEALTRKANLVTSQVNNIISEIHKLKNDIKNDIKIAFTVGTENGLIFEYVMEFQEQNPQYVISIVTQSDSEIEELLNAERLEIGILGAQGNMANLDFFLLESSSTYLVVNRENPLAKMKMVNMENLKNEHFIFGSSNYYANTRLFSVCNLAGFTPHLKHQTESINLIKKLVAHNRGIFLCPNNSAEQLNCPEIVLLPFEQDPHIFGHYLATKKNYTFSRQARELKTFLLEKKYNGVVQ